MADVPSRTIVARLRSLSGKIIVLATAERSFINRAGFAGFRRLPVYPGERTFLRQAGMSQKCHKRISSPSPIIGGCGDEQSTILADEDVPAVRAAIRLR
jgi:hypothetical protein